MTYDPHRCPHCNATLCFAPRTTLRFCSECGWEGSYTNERGWGDKTRQKEAT